MLPDLHGVIDPNESTSPLKKSVENLDGPLEDNERYVLASQAVNPLHTADDLGKDFTFGKFAAAKKAKVIEIKEMRQVSTDDLSTLQIQLQLPAGETYETAQNMVIFPRNTQNMVDKMLVYLEKSGAELVCLNPKVTPEELKKTVLSFPANTPLRSILAKFIDIKAPVK